MKNVVFLSHWGEDSKDANELAAQLRVSLDRRLMAEVDVFTTSSPADRFEEFDPGIGDDDWISSSRAYADDLRAYLQEHIDGAVAYLLLLTPHSVTRNSSWVRWEISVATHIAKVKSIPFIPCLAGVGYEALTVDAERQASQWDEWDSGVDDAHAHPEAEFQAVSLDTADGLTRLSSAIETSLLRQRSPDGG